MPRMEDCVDRIGNAKFVSKLDLLKGYWQVPLTNRALEMAFGFRNAAVKFQTINE